MKATARYCMVLTTTANSEEAENLAKKLVGERLCACVQVQQVKSFYMWKDEACSEAECLLFIKARTEQYPVLESFIRENHAYDTPEIIQVPVTDGSSDYFRWIDDVTGA